MIGTTTYITESPWMASYIRGIQPGAEAIPFFDSLDRVCPFSGPEDGDTRAEWLRTWLPDSEHGRTDAYQASIDELRFAQILSLEDIEYCFSEIESTPALSLMKEIFQLYAASPWANDRAAQCWQVVERLKNFEVHNPWRKQVIFVRGDEPTFLFAEYAKAFVYAEAVETTELVELKHLPFDENTPIGPLKPGSPAQLITELSKQVAQRLKESADASPVWISFLGQSPQQQLLQWALASEGIELNNWISGGPLHAVRRVNLIPFAELPLHSPASHFGFYDPEVPTIEPVETALSQWDRDRLAQKGVALDTEKDRLQRREAALAGFPRRGVLYLPKMLPQAAGRTVQWPARRKDQNLSSRENYDHPIRSLVLSATQLETFADCPSRYFFSYGTRIRKTIRQSFDEYPALFGQLVHTALEKAVTSSLVAQLAGSAEEASAALQTLDTAFHQTLTEKAPSLSEDRALYFVLVQHFRRLARQMPELERTRVGIFGQTEVLHTEKSFHWQYEGIQVSGKWDRIDSLPDGRILILDYKTGKVGFTPDHIRQGRHFQVLLYLVAAETLQKKPAGFLFYELKSGELKRGLIRQDALPAASPITRGHALKEEALQELCEQGLKHLHAYAKQIEQGHFSPTPSDAACGFCDYAAVCRQAFGFRA